VVTDGRGPLYVLDGVNRRLRAYAATTGRSLPQASATLPVGVYAGAAVDEANGDVYVMNELSNRLLRIAGGRVVGSTPAHLPGLTFSHLYASNGTVDIVTAQGDPPQPRRLRLLAAGEPNTDQRLQPIPPSPTAPAFTVSDTGRLTVAFGPDSTVRVDFGDPVVAADTIVVAAPGVVWSTVTTRVRGTWQRWLTRITPDGAVAMPLREPTTLPYENHSGTLAVTPTSAYLLTGDTAGGRVVEYTPGAAERR
jgi:hypothetical protein